MTAVIPEVEAADVTTVPPGEDVENGPALEARWPPIAAVLAFLALNVGLRLWLADEVLVGVRWLAPAIEVLLIIALLAADPTRLSRRPLWLRRLPLALVLVLVAGALWATALLLYHLITGAEVTDSPGRLLGAGALVWLGNNLIFALLYWLIDNGGPVARAYRPSPFPDFAFQQQMTPSSRRPVGDRPSRTTCISGSRTQPLSAQPM